MNTRSVALASCDILSKLWYHKSSNNSLKSNVKKRSEVASADAQMTTVLVKGKAKQELLRQICVSKDIIL